MTDAINAKSDVLSERELDSVSGGLIKGEVGVCRNDEVTETSKALSDFNAIVQKIAQG